MRNRKKTISVIATIALAAGAVAYLLWSSFDESMIYYKTVDELLRESPRFEGKTVRINGMLVPKSVRQKPGTDQFRFRLAKRGKVVEVAYAGILPDAMQDGRELVVQGILQAGGALFTASEILTKCPSKHEARAKEAGP